MLFTLNQIWKKISICTFIYIIYPYPLIQPIEAFVESVLPWQQALLNPFSNHTVPIKPWVTTMQALWFGKIMAKTSQDHNCKYITCAVSDLFVNYYYCDQNILLLMQPIAWLISNTFNSWHPSVMWRNKREAVAVWKKTSEKCSVTKFGDLNHNEIIHPCVSGSVVLTQSLSA